ncbi:MAG: insulinase family protein [Deltaproteobacteria bacterium]|nr:insulinase family protein [Deltaproteobacteria bacterium]
MRRLLQISFILVGVLFFSSLHAEPSFVNEFDSLEFPKLKNPDVTVEVLQNGMTCYLIEDNTLPIVKMQLINKTGSIYEQNDKLGLAQLTGMLMRSGGAAKRGPEEFDEAVDNIGAILGSAIGREKGSWTLAVLSEDLDRGMELLTDMVFRPNFDEKRLEAARLKLAESLRRQFDDPNTKASILYTQMIYGKNSPWARRPDPKKLPSITKNDIQEFHKRYFKTNNMIFTAAGNFKTKKLLKALKNYMKGSSEGEIEFPKIPATEQQFKAKVEKIVGPKSQSYVRMGHLGVKRHNPDWFSIYILSRVFGAGNFKSRLMEDIRTKRGLAYSVWGRIAQGTDYGLFTVGMSTGVENAEKAIDLVQGHVDRLAEGKDVTTEEVEFAKRGVLSTAIFELDSPFKIVNDRAKFHFYGYPSNYWLVAYDGVAAVSKDDVNRAAEKYMHPDRMNVLILGPK